MRCIATLLLAGAVLAQEAPNLATTAPPAAKVTRKRAIETAVAFLVEHQNKDGSFGKHTSGRTWEVTAAVPGGHQAFQSATTSLCWMGLNDASHQPAASLEAQKKALSWLVKRARVKRARGGELYNTWSFAYGLQALVQAYRKKAPGASPDQLRKAIREMIEVTAKYQTPDGGWGYYDFRVKAYKPSWSTAFTTASTVIALQLAERAGFVVPAKVLDDGARSVLRCRTPTGSYLYGWYLRYGPRYGINQAKGSSLRTQACNLALLLAGRKEVKRKELRAGLDQLVDHHRFAIAGVHRPIPHESWYQVSGYFYLYGHRYASLVLEHLPDQADQRKYWPAVVSSVLKTRQPDGSFWDYPLYGYHKFYGTGYALMTLSRCPDEVVP